MFDEREQEAAQVTLDHRHSLLKAEAAGNRETITALMARLEAAGREKGELRGAVAEAVGL